MVCAKFNEWVNGHRKRLVWIEFDRYAHQVFANNTANWHADANAFVSGIGQALSVVNTDVVSFDLIAPYTNACEFNGAEPAQAIQQMLELEAPGQFTQQVVDALAHRFADQSDLMLKIPSPAQLLRQAGYRETPSFDDLDDVGIALSNLLREFSSKELAGVLVFTNEVISADEAEALESVLGAARHYGWHIALSLDETTTIPKEFPEIDCDILLFPNVEADHFVTHDQGSSKFGGALTPDYWRDDSKTVEGTPCDVLYGQIPFDALPELVIKRIASLSV